MARTLEIYLHHHLAGHLTEDDGGQMFFRTFFLRCSPFRNSFSKQRSLGGTHFRNLHRACRHVIFHVIDDGTDGISPH